MGDMYMTPIPDCPAHGRMQPAPDGEGYVCNGFDGEGCAHRVAAIALPWQYLGTADDGDLDDILRRGDDR